MFTEKQLSAKIRGIGQRQATLRQDIHEAAIQVAAHAQVHGRATYAEPLFGAVKGQDRHALMSWFHKNTCVKINVDGKATVNKVARKNFDGSGDELVAYLETVIPWYDTVKTIGQVARDLDVAKRIERLAKDISKGEKSIVGADPESIRNALAQLQAALAAAEAVERAREDSKRPVYQIEKPEDVELYIRLREAA